MLCFQRFTLMIEGSLLQPAGGRLVVGWWRNWWRNKKETKSKPSRFTTLRIIRICQTCLWAEAITYSLQF